MIDDILSQLSCPNCATELVRDGDRLVCEEGHGFDVARQGYVSLLRGDHHAGTADTAGMVAARDRLLSGGHYAGIARLIAGLALPALAAAPAGTCVVDLGAGTGFYLASLLYAADAAAPGFVGHADPAAGAGRAPLAGIALDISKYAARYAVRCHPRIGAVVADAWQTLPVRGQAAAVVLNVFAPRNPHEMRRILHPDGRAVVVVPEPDHLRELIAEYGLLTVDERKRDRIEAQFAGLLAIEDEGVHRETLSLTQAQVASVIGMGPNARHPAAAMVPGPAPLETTTTDVTLAVRAYVLRRV